jgi:hypothetical protein
MTYSVKRYLGYRPWGVTNPWVFANLAQPQRRRVPSNYIFQTHAPRAGIHPLGQISELLAPVANQEARARRMEMYALIGLTMTATFYAATWMRGKKMVRNRRKRRAR